MPPHPVREKYRSLLREEERRVKPVESNRVMMYALLASVIGVCLVAAALSGIFSSLESSINGASPS